MRTNLLFKEREASKTKTKKYPQSIFSYFFISGGKAYFKTNLDTEGVQGIWHCHGRDSAATDLVDALVSEIFKGKDLSSKTTLWVEFAIKSCCLSEYFPWVHIWIKTFSCTGQEVKGCQGWSIPAQARAGLGSGGCETWSHSPLSSLGYLVSVFPFKNKSAGWIISLVFLNPAFYDFVTVSVYFPSVKWKQCSLYQLALSLGITPHKRKPGEGNAIYWASEVGQELYRQRPWDVIVF